MTEKVLLDNGYKYFPNEHPRSCDKYYQKKLAGFDDEPTKFIAVYYYDKFKAEYKLDCDFEFELMEEKEHYWKQTYLYAIDYPYTIEEIESILLNGTNEQK